MPLKTRIGVLPSANFYAQIIAYLTKAYPKAQIHAGMLEDLKPIWDSLWQDGRTADVVARTTCSCDGKTITPSPVLALPALPRGAVRAPAKAERGRLFEPSQIRESAQAERVKRIQARTTDEITRAEARASRLEGRAGRLPVQSRQAILEQAAQQRAGLVQKRAQAAQLGKQLEELRAQLGALRLEFIETQAPKKTAAKPKPTKPAKETKLPKEAKPPEEAKAPKEAKPPKETKPGNPAAEPQAAKPPGEPKPAKAPKPPKPKKEDKDAAILASITAALPSIAEQLAKKLRS